MNETFSEIYGFVPLNDKEKADFAARYLPILDPKFIKAVQLDDQLIGFAIGLPDISAGIKACQGEIASLWYFQGTPRSQKEQRSL